MWNKKMCIQGVKSTFLVIAQILFFSAYPLNIDILQSLVLGLVLFLPGWVR